MTSTAGNENARGLVREVGRGLVLLGLTGSSTSSFPPLPEADYSSTPPSDVRATRAASSTRLRPRSSSASIATWTPFRRVGPTSPRTARGLASYVATSKSSRPYWNDSGLRRFAESYSTLAFPPPSSTIRNAASASAPPDLSTCEWIRRSSYPRTTW
jgi:hypothetical protein